MNKIYEKPEIELVSLTAEQDIASDGILDGDQGMKSSVFG